MTVSPSTIVINSGESSTKECSGGSFRLKVSKKEENLTYKVTVSFKEIVNNRPCWSFFINDRQPFHKGTAITWEGSQILSLAPFDKKTIALTEIDEHTTTSCWIDLSEAVYELYLSMPIKIDIFEPLLEKGKTFVPFDGKKVNKVLYSRLIGVFLYVKSSNGWNDNIYYATANAQEFSKCEVAMTSQARSPEADSIWDVTLPTKEEGTLKFPQGIIANMHAVNTLDRLSWNNNIQLKLISL